MMGLDGAAFQYIGIDGALRKEVYSVELSRFVFKNSDKLRADYLALLFGFGNAGELIQKPVNGVDVDKVGFHLIAEDLYDLFGFAFAQQTVVDVDADEVFADSFN